jgi:hypothetical protein
VTRADFVRGRREEAWASGRALGQELLAAYNEKYHPVVLPPPAFIMSELLTDILGCRLEYGALPLAVFAQTEWLADEVIVTVNSLTSSMSGVKDARGVQNVAECHECIHVVDDSPSASAPQGMLAF